MKNGQKNVIEKIIQGQSNTEDQNIALTMAIDQGYVPKDCKLNGELVMCLVNSGKNPCDGCNISNCSMKQTK